ncbi:MAG: ribonuclease P protein component [Candidatus Roizmanbacteria bacterium]|nr:ribonuclease P protein component [Candidatus Roizmanbacteria bacterium]
MPKEGVRVPHALFPHFRSGKRLKSEIGVLQITPHTQQPNRARFTVVVPRKVAPSAVDRNRIKRRIRGLFTTQTVPPGFIYIFYPTVRVLSLPHRSLKTAFVQLVTQNS